MKRISSFKLVNPDNAVNALNNVIETLEETIEDFQECDDLIPTEKAELAYAKELLKDIYSYLRVGV